MKVRLVFIESICTDERVIASNVRETKLKSPDYKGETEDAAVEDFLKRIAHYVSVYQPIADEEGAYIKVRPCLCVPLSLCPSVSLSVFLVLSLSLCLSTCVWLLFLLWLWLCGTRCRCCAFPL